MKLYYSPGACSLSPHIVLNEAGFDFTLERVDLKAHLTSSGVPLVDIERLTEGAMIVQYLADQKPELGLIPRVGTMERYRVLEWLNYIASELHKTFYPLFHLELAVDDWREAARAKIARDFKWVNEQLDGRDYLMGERFSVADAYLFTVANWAHRVKIDLAQWPVLARYHARVASRPRVQDTLRAEGLTVKLAA